MRKLILILSFLLISSGLHAQDYERQLGHRIKQLSDGLSQLALKYPKFEVDFVCITESLELANFAAQGHAGKSSVVKQPEGMYFVKLRHTINSEGFQSQQWLRLQFFIGVAYHCSMNGLAEVSPYAL